MASRTTVEVLCCCGAALARYQKRGKGRLVKMFLSRILVDHAGVFLTEPPLVLRAVRVDLEFHLFEVDGGIRARVFFATDLFERETIERLVGHYRRIVESAVATPSARLTSRICGASPL